MNDLSYRLGERRFWIRAWLPFCGIRPLTRIVDVLRQLWDSEYDDYRRVNVWSRTQTHTNARCYCPVGSVTEFHVDAFGFGLWFDVQRGGPVKPCHCDKIIWLMFPENHPDEIEEYGLAKLQAEYPGVGP